MNTNTVTCEKCCCGQIVKIQEIKIKDNIKNQTFEQLRLCCNCGICGPWSITAFEAVKEWNWIVARKG